jgi:hypothetical protein
MVKRFFLVVLAMGLAGCATAPTADTDPQCPASQFVNATNPMRCTALSSPGPIGGTLSNTIQATRIAVGASVPTLPGTDGDFIATHDIHIGRTIVGDASVGISGGGALSGGSNSYTGSVTGLAAANNILTPGFTCPNAVVAIFQDNVTPGGILLTASSTTAVTFSATANDRAGYITGCR